jgi:hypothetical protein
MASWRRRAGDPYAEMPAALRVFDPLEWAAPGEVPDENDVVMPQKGIWDYHHCWLRYSAAFSAWFDDHPEADVIEFLRERRARRG